MHFACGPLLCSSLIVVICILGVHPLFYSFVIVVTFLYMHFGCGPLLYCACVCFALLYSGCGYFAVVWLCFVCYTCSLIVVALLYTVFVVALL